MDLTELTISESAKGIKEKKFSALELTKAYLENIKKNDKEINSYLTVFNDEAITVAKEVDEKGADNDLSGIPVAIKDAILVKGEKCTAASKMLESYIAPYNATVVKKLKEKGSVILGKTNLDEFAMGSSGENSAFGATKNPKDTSKVPGGSSSGSAAAVATRQACYSLGSDTGGSVRLPASFCGVVGLRPTYGAVSRYGLIAFASSLDQIGPITKNVDDCKTVFNAISGKDSMDATSSDFKFQDSSSKLKEARIGVPKEYFTKGLDSRIEKTIKDIIKKSEDQGAEIIEVSLPHTELALACYYIIAPAEASANLARYDGIRYGSSVKADTFFNEYIETRGQGFGREVKRRIMIGTYVLSSGYYDAYYKKAEEVRNLIRKDFKDALSKVDFIFSPVSPVMPPKIGEKTKDPLSMYLMDIYAVPASLAGLPALSMPVGNIDGLPVGLQITANNFEENRILSIASEIEKMVQ